MGQRAGARTSWGTLILMWCCEHHGAEVGAPLLGNLSPIPPVLLTDNINNCYWTK